MIAYVIHKTDYELPDVHSFECFLNKCIHRDASVLGIYTKKNTAKRLVTFWNNRGKSVKYVIDFLVEEINTPVA